jgi:hypothetical protein
VVIALHHDPVASMVVDVESQHGARLKRRRLGAHHHAAVGRALVVHSNHGVDVVGGEAARVHHDAVGAKRQEKKVHVTRRVALGISVDQVVARYRLPTLDVFKPTKLGGWLGCRQRAGKARRL